MLGSFVGSIMYGSMLVGRSHSSGRAGVVGICLVEMCGVMVFNAGLRRVGREAFGRGVVDVRHPKVGALFSLGSRFEEAMKHEGVSVVGYTVFVMKVHFVFSCGDFISWFVCLRNSAVMASGVKQGCVVAADLSMSRAPSHTKAHMAFRTASGVYGFGAARRRASLLSLRRCWMTRLCLPSRDVDGKVVAWESRFRGVGGARGRVRGQECRRVLQVHIEEGHKVGCHVAKVCGGVFGGITFPCPCESCG